MTAPAADSAASADASSPTPAPADVTPEPAPPPTITLPVRLFRVQRGADASDEKAVTLATYRDEGRATDALRRLQGDETDQYAVPGAGVLFLAAATEDVTIQAATATDAAGLGWSIDLNALADRLAQAMGAQSTAGA